MVGSLATPLGRWFGVLLLINCLQGPGSAQGSTHEIEAGDTLTGIARRYDTTVEAIRQANGLTSDLLRVGARLRLPAAAGWDLWDAPADTSWRSLSERTGRSEAVLRSANPHMAEPAGREVLIPPADGPLAWPAAGEDLIAVAARLGVAPGRLAAVNGLSAPYDVAPGRPLLVPAPSGPTPGVDGEAPVTPETPGTGPVAPAPGATHAQPTPGATAADPRALHAGLRQEALAELALLLRDRVLTPPDDGFAWPLDGPPRLTSLFGWRSVSVGGNRYHQGLDLGASSGTPVRAAREGVVTRAGWVGAYGYAVYLSHDGGFETRYAHLSRLNVRVGERLGQGDEVGAVGSTGASTGPHLHFEARLDGRALDPLEILPALR